MIIRRTQNKFGIKKDGAWQKKQFSIWEFFLLLLSKAPYIVLAALLGAGLSLCYFKMMVPPRYTATAKLYITGQETLNLKLLSIRTGTLLTVDYQEVFKTWEIQENAADFQGSESQLLRPEQVEVSNPVGTRVLYISYTSEDPQCGSKSCKRLCAGRPGVYVCGDGHSAAGLVFGGGPAQRKLRAWGKKALRPWALFWGRPCVGGQRDTQ